MRRLLVIAAVSALALAKPELYKESEDFQYSRSSSDEGSKAGFYGAQRGNMGGNFEKAHNMDGLAQHQMSGLVRQVEGELGNGYQTRTGSVYTAANSRGIYGSGNYDLSNLKGRNFEETDSFGTSLSHSRMSQNAGFEGQSLLNSAAYSSSNSRAHTSGGQSLLNSAAYSNSNSRAHSSGYSGHQATGHSEQFIQSDNLQLANNLQGAHEYDYRNQEAQYSKAGLQSRHAYDQSNTNLEQADVYGLNSRTRLLKGTPVRVVVRPGARVTIPIATQTYGAGQVDSSLDQSNVNSETELLSTSGQQVNYKPSNTPKHYESSYSYRKEWEKHNTQPVTVPFVIPTVNPFPVHSELYDEREAAHLANSQYQSNVDSYNSRASNSAYIANTKSAASSRSRYQEGYNAQHSGASMASNSNGYNVGTHTSNADANGVAVGSDSTNLVELLGNKPKSYHSSYSYHKAWERQGDPYIIKPVGSGFQEGQVSQKLTSSNHGTYNSHHYGSQYKQAQQSFSQHGADCDEEGHIRVARSYNSNQEQQFEDYQNVYQGQEELAQHTQDHLENLEDFGQQTQNNFDNLQNLGQQTQNLWGGLQDLGQQSQHQWDNLQDFGQQTQNQGDNLQDFGQQTQEKFDKLENLGQQTETKWEKVADLGQETQNKWDKIEDLGQETQNKWDKIDDLTQQSQTGWEKTQQHSRSELEDLSQQTLSNVEQQIQSHGLEDSKTETRLNAFDNFDQQSQGQWNVFESSNKYDTQHTNINIQNKNNVNNNLSQKELSPNIWTNIQQSLDDSKQTQNANFDLRKHNQTSTHDHEQRPLWKQSEDSIDKNVQSTSITNSLPENFGTQDNHHFFNNDNKETRLNRNEWNANGNSDFSNTFWNAHYDTHSNHYHSQIESGQILHTKSEQNSSPLGSLWDKLDGIVKETLTEDNDSDTAQKHDSQYLPYLLKEKSVNNPHFSPKPPESQPENPQEYQYSTKTNKTIYHGNNVQPIDVGRGDIGPEDTDTMPDISDTFQINKPYKTPQEIESLSLTQKSNEVSPNLGTEKHVIDTTDTLNVLSINELKLLEEVKHKFETNQKSEQTLTSTISTLNVLSIDELKLLEELKHKLMTNQKTEQILTSTISTPPRNNIDQQQSRNYDITETQFVHQNSQHKPITNKVQTLARENKAFESASTEQLKLDQQIEDFDQQTQDLQSQSQLQDFGQQLQTVWQPQDNLEQVQYQQMSDFKELSKTPEQVQLNYNHQYQKLNSEQTNKQSEENEASQNTKINGKIDTPVEPVTEKSGFWKSVGSKLTNAKDKVVSWFGGN